MQGLLLPNTLRSLVRDCVQEIAGHAQSQTRHPMGLLIHNDPHSAALLIAAQQLNMHAVVLAGNRREELQPLAEVHTGITTMLENTPAGLTLSRANEDGPRPPVVPFMTEFPNGSACLFTSGSTGDPKVVAYEWEALLFQASETLRRTPLLGPQTAHIPRQFVAASPIAHAYAINAVFTCHLGSLALGLPPRGSEREYLLGTSELSTAILGTPALYRTLLKSLQDGDDLRHVREPYSAGCSLPAETWLAFRERFGLRIMQNFGTTETGNIAVFEAPRNQPPTPGFVGKPWGEIRFRDSRTLQEAPGDSQAEIMVRVPWMSKGYVERGELRRHSQFHPTGDYGKLVTGGTEEGLVVGRRIRAPLHLKDDDVDPRLIELLLEDHPLVDECVAVQGDGGSSLGVFVVPSVSGTALTPQELVAWWQEARTQHTPPLPPLMAVKVVPDLPRSPAGKIIFKALTWEVLQAV